MKLLHTSDWHLGKYLHEYSLITDQKHILQQILEYLKKEPHDALMIAGDIFDRSLPPEDAVALFSTFLQDLRGFSDIPVCIIPGNHDSALRLSYGAEMFKLAHIHFGCNPNAIAKPVSIQSGSENIDIYLVPFLHPNTYREHTDEKEPKTPTHHSVWQEAVDKIYPGLNPSHLNILAGHLFTIGGESSDSERIFVGAISQVSPHIFDKFDFVTLGHLHRPQRITNKMYYSGSPLAYSFSESGQDKQLLSVDITKKSLSVTPIPLRPRHPVSRLKGNFESLLKSDDYNSYKEHFLEVDLTDPLPVPNAMSTLQNRFPFLLNLRQSHMQRGQNARRVFLQQAVDETEQFEQFHKYITGQPAPEALKSFYNKQLSQVLKNEAH